jgi:hypothetical protein
MAPFLYRDISYDKHWFDGAGAHNSTPCNDNSSGLGDILVEPLLLHWSFRQIDLMAGAGVWLPTGRYDNAAIANLGGGTWSPMLTLGGVWYPDQAKTWAISLLNRYEFNSQSPATRYTTDPAGFPLGHPSNVSCSTYTLEWGVSKMIVTNWDLGIIGYYQKQFTAQGEKWVRFNDPEAISIGPEITWQIPSQNLLFSLRDAIEISADQRPQGNMVNLSVTKSF